MDYTHVLNPRHMIKIGFQLDRTSAKNKTRLFAFAREEEGEEGYDEEEHDEEGHDEDEHDEDEHDEEGHDEDEGASHEHGHRERRAGS